MPVPTPDEWLALSPQLDKALGVTDDERSMLFASMPTWNRALVDQLEAMLGHHRALVGEGFLDESIVAVPGDCGLTGKTLGVYTLLTQLGQGGMGSVWLAARNDARFERKVAVKFLNIALLGMAGEERFKREGIILGRLSHPNIAELIDAGISPAGQPYLVLEYVEGEHIDSYCDRCELSVEARIRLFLDVLQAINEAHANLIVHRDLKPSNILVRKDGQVKLLDFGIAKLLEHEGALETTITREHGRPMTPEYAAPEQLKGEPVTTATDVYALGVLLHVLLTGCHPAGSDSQNQATLFRFILDTEPSRPSEVVRPTAENTEAAISNATRRTTTPDRLSRMLRGDLDTIVVTALKKNSEQRYASVRAMADDLRRYLSHEPIRARPDTTAYRAVKFLRRHRSPVAAILAAVAVLIGATTWTLSRGAATLPQFKQRRLTAASRDLPVLHAAISPDGRYLGYGDQRGIHLQLLETGGIQDVPPPSGDQPGKGCWEFVAWNPDSARFLASYDISGTPVSLWWVPLSGQGARKLAEIDDLTGVAKISPDGSTIAYERWRSSFGAREIWLMGSQGESPRKLLTAEKQASFRELAWSPAGNRIAYSYARRQGDRTDVSVQSCDLNGARKITMLQENKLNSFIWLSSGRFIYSRIAARGAAESDNLFELRVDANLGSPHGQARRLTDWSGFSISRFSATKDGKQLAFLKGNEHGTVFVGDLTSNGNRLANTQRLTTDDNINLPLAWTPDSREVVFSSQHAAIRTLYRQAPDGNDIPQPLTSTPDMNFYLARVSPDKKWLLVEGEPKGSTDIALYRVGLSGGVPQRLFPLDGLTQFFCTAKAANFCVLGRPDPDRNELVISSFQPEATDRKELLRIALDPDSDARLDYVWQLSPDGSRLGVLKRRQNQMQIFQIDGGTSTTVTVKGYSDLTELNWATDSRSMFVSSWGARGSALLHVDLKGDAQSIWQQPQISWVWGFPSPDDRHLALLGSSSEANAWMISDF